MFISSPLPVTIHNDCMQQKLYSFTFIYLSTLSLLLRGDFQFTPIPAPRARVYLEQKCSESNISNYRWSINWLATSKRHPVASSSKRRTRGDEVLGGEERGGDGDLGGGGDGREEDEGNRWGAPRRADMPKVSLEESKEEKKKDSRKGEKVHK